MNERKNPGGWTHPRGCKSLKLETIEVNKWYAFTINLSQRTSQWLICYQEYDKMIKEELGKTCKKAEYIFTPEQSEFGRFHMHGKIKFSKLKDIGFFYAFLGYLQCNYKFDTIEDLAVWDSYMYKQKMIQEQLASYYSVPYEVTSSNHRMAKLEGS